MAADVVKETELLRQESTPKRSFTVNGKTNIDTLFTSNNDGAMELIMTVEPENASIAGFELLNKVGEKVKIYFDMKQLKLVMDRTESGLIEFGELSEPHFIEAHDDRKTTSINYINDFALATWAPFKKEKSYKLHVFVDVCSVEIFLNDGKVAMTNLVFPTMPYDEICFYSEGGQMNIIDFTTYKLGL